MNQMLLRVSENGAHNAGTLQGQFSSSSCFKYSWYLFVSYRISNRRTNRFGSWSVACAKDPSLVANCDWMIDNISENVRESGCWEAIAECHSFNHRPSSKVSVQRLSTSFDVFQRLSTPCRPQNKEGDQSHSRGRERFVVPRNRFILLLDPARGAVEDGQRGAGLTRRFWENI